MAPANRNASPVLNCLCAQDDLEPVLRRFAEAQTPAELRFNTEMTAVEQDAEGVTATLADRAGGAETTVRAQYLIGADGAQSRVRRIVARQMIGREGVYDSVNIVFRADLRPWTQDRPAALYFVEQALAGASVVVDVSNSPSFADEAVMSFFTTSTSNLLAAEAKAGVGHHVALSVVGTERLLESGYFRAKMAQEKLIKESSIPYSIVHATQFYEFLKSITQAATDGNTVHLAPVLIQPMAADDVAAEVGRVAAGAPVNGRTEVGGPEQFRLDELARRVLHARNDARRVATDIHALYFGTELGGRSLTPGSGARIAPTRFEDWLRQSAV